MPAERYPTYSAGQRITASLLSSGLPQTARKTADTSRTSTTTVSADPHLTFSVEANGVYIWHGWIKYDADSAGDVQLDWTVPAGSLGEWTGWGIGLGTTTQTSNGYSIRVETNDVEQFRTWAGLGTGALITVQLHGTLRVGSIGGTFSMDWAQGTSSATATTLYTDSWLTLQRIA